VDGISLLLVLLTTLLVPVSVLEAVCESAQAEGLLVPLLDAYRGQVFAGVYQKHSKGVELRRAETVERLSDWLAELERGGYGSEPLTFVGPHLERWKDALAASSFAAAPQERTSTLLAEAVARRARWKWRRGQAVDALHLRANYVRPSDAELLWKEK
jgi:tRNA A37 threonylcarbamoyladenosine modification protein TsaB